MKSFFKSLPIFLISVVVVVLMVANRNSVILSLNPLQYELVVPLYLVFFMGLFFGLILSTILLLTRKLQTQVNLHRANKENIRLRKQLIALEKEFDTKTDAHLAGTNLIEDKAPLKKHLVKNF